MTNIGWGIVGYGVIDPAKAMTAVPGAELIGVCDVDPKREQVLRKQGYQAAFRRSRKSS